MVAGRKVLLLAADDFEDMELLYPLYRLIEEDVAVTVAGLDDHPVTGKKGHGPVPVDTTADQVAEADFDALVIPGGYAPDKLRRSEAVLGLVRDFDTAGKPVAFICHAGWVPISAKILKGRRATSVGAIRDDMVNAGVDWVDEATVVDGNLISAPDPGRPRPVDEGAARRAGLSERPARRPPGLGPPPDPVAWPWLACGIAICAPPAGLPNVGEERAPSVMNAAR